MGFHVIVDVWVKFKALLLEMAIEAPPQRLRGAQIGSDLPGVVVLYTRAHSATTCRSISTRHCHAFTSIQGGDDGLRLHPFSAL